MRSVDDLAFIPGRRMCETNSRCVGWILFIEEPDVNNDIAIDLGNSAEFMDWPIGSAYLFTYLVDIEPPILAMRNVGCVNNLAEFSPSFL
jgi:hypothetical protein